MPAENRLEETERKRSLRAPHPMTLVWITVIRGVMAIGLGLGLAFSGDRAPAAIAHLRRSSPSWASTGC
jgi:hypothetical protein